MNDLLDAELLAKYQQAKKWLIEREHVSGTIRNTLGFIYDHDKWMEGLRRLEAIEDEMKKRQIAY